MLVATELVYTSTPTVVRSGTAQVGDFFFTKKNANVQKV